MAEALEHIARRGRWHYNGSLALLSTCRQAYAEAKLLSFSLNTITGHVGNLNLHMSRSLTAWQFDAVTAMRVSMDKTEIDIGLFKLRPSFGRFLGEVGASRGLRRVTIVYRGLITQRLSDDAKGQLLAECRGHIGRSDVELDVELERKGEKGRWVLYRAST